MSVKEYPNASMVKPHRCAFLMDDIIDAVHHWDKAEMKDAYRTWRACMKNKEINADLSQKPRYVNPKENSDELFDAKKVSERAQKAREEEKAMMNQAKHKSSQNGNDKSSL
ncbi:hypothetical protein WA171_005761 [Blastocystis sp. BT1]